MRQAGAPGFVAGLRAPDVYLYVVPAPSQGLSPIGVCREFTHNQARLCDGGTPSQGANDARGVRGLALVHRPPGRRSPSSSCAEAAQHLARRQARSRATG
eukprot:scaffold689_cov375-Prasinococcus_capsulatus_cf.AAC.19